MSCLQQNATDGTIRFSASQAENAGSIPVIDTRRCRRRRRDGSRGFAISRRYDPDTARNGIYDALQTEAEAAGRGLWAPDTCGPAAAEVSIDLDIRYDADGNDNDNKNDEWVRFTNAGSAPLELNDWIVLHDPNGDNVINESYVGN